MFSLFCLADNTWQKATAGKASGVQLVFLQPLERVTLSTNNEVGGAHFVGCQGVGSWLYHHLVADLRWVKFEDTPFKLVGFLLAALKKRSNGDTEPGTPWVFQGKPRKPTGRRLHGLVYF